jgi:hypothetical protein
MRTNPSWLFVTALLLALPGLSVAETFDLRILSSVPEVVPVKGGGFKENKPPQMMLQVQALDQRRKITPFTPGSPAWNKSAYKVEAVKGTKRTTVALKNVYAVETIQGYQTIYLEPEKPLDIGAAHEVALIPPGAWRVRDGTIDGPGSVGVDVLKAEDEYNKLIATKNHVDIERAEKGTALSFNARYIMNKPLTVENGATHLEASIRGNVALDTKKYSVYSDNFEAELGFFYGSYLGRKKDVRSGWPFFIGLDSRLEADRDFSVVNGAHGVWTKLFTPDLPPFHWLSRGLLPEEYRSEEATPAPLWEFGYQFITRYKEDEGASDYGDQRLSGRFTWEMALFRKMPFPVVETLDGDLNFQIGGIYHLESGEFTDETKVQLTLTKDRYDPKAIMMTLTYARGKTTPKFEHYDAVLAGFKKLF